MAEDPTPLCDVCVSRGVCPLPQGLCPSNGALRSVSEHPSNPLPHPGVES